MPEYKRFIAYFYEYIDGRKQKNTGFAKVELRNGMWRILFRIRTDQLPEPPVQVFGFVREREYLLGFLLGNMTAGYEIAEEWAYGADKAIGHEKYRFGNLSGIWIQSGDGHRFITVWDDDPVDVEKFVLQIPQETTDVPERVYEEKEEVAEDSSEVDITDVSVKAYAENKNNEKECMENYITELFRKRKRFEPFREGKSGDCIQIMPCDIVMLQQKGWQAGRSSFLQHGFYHHHHLLLIKNSDGTYIIGVPGFRNEQEQYMARMFGYEEFKTARIFECGKVFGYWCRKLYQI